MEAQLAELKQALLDVYPYCDNCAGANDDNCDDCHRKSMGWRFSESAVDTIIEHVFGKV